MSFEEVFCILVPAATILRLLVSTRHILEAVPVGGFSFLESSGCSFSFLGFSLGFQGFVVGADVSSGKFGGHLFCELGFLEAGAEPKAWRTLQWRQRRRTG